MIDQQSASWHLNWLPLVKSEHLMSNSQLHNLADWPLLKFTMKHFDFAANFFLGTSHFWEQCKNVVIGRSMLIGKLSLNSIQWILSVKFLDTTYLTITPQSTLWSPQPNTFGQNSQELTQNYATEEIRTTHTPKKTQYSSHNSPNSLLFSHTPYATH